MKSEKMMPISLRGHHLNTWGFFLSHQDAEEQLKVSLAKYGKEFINNTISVLKTITTSPADTSIKLIDDKDIICKVCKRNYGRKCKSYDDAGMTDRITICYYGLELGRVYPATEIIKILQLFEKRNPSCSRGDGLIVLLNDTAKIFEEIKVQKIKDILNY